MLLLPTAARAALCRFRHRGLLVRSWPDLALRPEFRRASIAIVGNAGYLTELDQGRLIDSHDLVLRMNNFQTAGFERQVGWKLNLFLTTFHSDVNLANPAIDDAGIVVASVPYNWSKRGASGLNQRHAEFIAQGLTRLGRREVFVPQPDYFQKLQQAIGKYPTTGAMGLCLALDYLLPHCGRIFVTGFSFFEGKSHYFSDRQIDPKNHHPDRERLYFNRRLAPHLLSGRVQLDPWMKAQVIRRAA